MNQEDEESSFRKGPSLCMNICTEQYVLENGRCAVRYPLFEIFFQVLPTGSPPHRLLFLILVSEKGHCSPKLAPTRYSRSRESFLGCTCDLQVDRNRVCRRLHQCTYTCNSPILSRFHLGCKSIDLCYTTSQLREYLGLKAHKWPNFYLAFCLLIGGGVRYGISEELSRNLRFPLYRHRLEPQGLEQPV